MPVHLPDDHSATVVRDSLLATIKTLPEHLWKSLTGTKVASWPSTPRSPWPRRWTSTSVTPLAMAARIQLRTGCCASTSKGADLSVHSPARLLEVATELNARPRKTLGGLPPAKAMQRLLFGPERPIVATTA